VSNCPAPDDVSEVFLVTAGDTVTDAWEKYELQNRAPPNIYVNLGLLTLGTALRNRLDTAGETRLTIRYFDGTLFDEDMLIRHIAAHPSRVFMLAFSTYTSNYGATLRLAQLAKAINPNIVTVFGNDHFSALYENILRRNEATVDYGFYGNDVTEGFADFAVDLWRDGYDAGGRRQLPDLRKYSGLVYRDGGRIAVNPEDPSEFYRLPLVDYSLANSWLDHHSRYHAEQRKLYAHRWDRDYRMTVVDIARGCIKFSGPRSEKGIPDGACNFCAIIPGTKAIAAHTHERAWEILRNAWDQGSDYFWVTADELPTTFWPLLREMAEHRPAWYEAIPKEARPKLLCYARSDAFRKSHAHRIDALVDRLNVDVFWIGLEAFSATSLHALNKGYRNRIENAEDVMVHNLVACEEIARRGCQLGAGIIITHLGITPAIMDRNYDVLEQFIGRHSRVFSELLPDLLHPLPGSHAYEYLCTPGAAQSAADTLGLKIDNRYLAGIHDKYIGSDCPDPAEILQDFMRGCCPDISMDQAMHFIGKIQDLQARYGIVSEIGSLHNQ